MATVFLVTTRGGAVIGEADNMDGVLTIAKNARPGRYRIEQISLDPYTGDTRSWNCGAISKDRKGAIKLRVQHWRDRRQPPL